MDSLLNLFEHVMMFFHIRNPADRFKELVNFDDFQLAIMVFDQCTRAFDPVAAVCIQDACVINKSIFDPRFVNVSANDPV